VRKNEFSQAFGGLKFGHNVSYPDSRSFCFREGRPKLERSKESSSEPKTTATPNFKTRPLFVTWRRRWNDAKFQTPPRYIGDMSDYLVTSSSSLVHDTRGHRRVAAHVAGGSDCSRAAVVRTTRPIFAFLEPALSARSTAAYIFTPCFNTGQAVAAQSLTWEVGK